jgi:hypothetical protein
MAQLTPGGKYFGKTACVQPLGLIARDTGNLYSAGHPLSTEFFMKIQTIPSIVLFSTLFSSAAMAQAPLNIARYDDQGRLSFPVDAATWVQAGSVLGGNYSEAPFDPARPGTIGVVQMEPKAYAYFLEHGEYADGTMFLLSFYAAQAKSQPQLSGFVQGDLRLREIHVIDKARFSEGRAFFQFEKPDQSSSARLGDDSPCIRCHTAEGARDGTFVQFYPTLRSLSGPK